MGNYRRINRTLVTWFSTEDWWRTYSHSISYCSNCFCHPINQRKTITVRKGVAKSATPFLYTLLNYRLLLSNFSVYACISQLFPVRR